MVPDYWLRLRFHPKNEVVISHAFLNKYNNYYQQNTHNKSSVFTGIDKVLDALTEKENSYGY